MRKKWIRLLLAGAFLAGAVTIVGAAKIGTPIETSVGDICEEAVWPRIPAHCFGSEPVRPVFAAAGAVSVEPARQQRSSDADSISSKADLLRRPEAIHAYQTVEIRGDGVSELKRVPRLTAASE